MFTGIHEEINSALQGAGSQAADVLGRIEIELRLYSYDARRREGVGSEGAWKRALIGMLKLVQKPNSGWSKMHDGTVQKDVVTKYADDWRTISVAGESVVSQRKFSEPAWRIPVKEYPGRMSFAIEQDAAIPSGVNQVKHPRRERARMSFSFGSPVLVRVDFTTALEEGDKHEQIVTYEVEIEAVGDFTPLVEKNGRLLLNEVQAKMDEIATYLYRYVNETPLPYSTALRKSVISSINVAALKQKEKIVDTHILDSWINKPRSLERRDLSSGTVGSMFPGVVSGVEAPSAAIYSVTIKTDGRRVLAFWDESGLYLCSPFASTISRILSYSMPPAPSLVGTILDCELLEEGLIPEQTTFRLYIFDCMFIRAKGQVVDVRSKPLFDRLALAKYAVGLFNQTFASLGSNFVIQMEVKRFIPFVDRETFYKANREALRLNLNADRTEMYKSDGLVFTDMGPYLREALPPACDCRRAGGKWCESCSSFNKTRNLKYKEVKNLTVDFLIKFDQHSKKTINTEDRSPEYARFGYRPFTGDRRYPIPATLFKDLIDEGAGPQELEEGKIVEMMWDKDPADDLHKWIPVRIRRDRVAPNKTGVALTNWELIHNPIPVGVLLGVLKGRKVLYFMRQYHNRVKQEVLNYYNNEIWTRYQREGRPGRPVLFDIGPGKGGDTKKWAMTSFEVIGVEPDATELEELARRVTAEGISGRVSTLNKKVQDTQAVVSKMRLIGKEADLVTSFFSMTLIYESAQSVQAFVQTVKEVIAPGGFFVCTALDGKAVNRVLGDNVQLSMEGIKIQRSATKKNQITIRFPAADQRIATGQVEFLVDFDYLITLMEGVGFRLIKDRYLDTEVVLNDSERFYSQLNRLIEMRYDGLKKDPQPSKRLDELLTIMKAIPPPANVPHVEVDEIVQIPPRLCTELGSTGKDTFWTFGVLGGGSCFLHAILWCIYTPYRTMTANERFEFVVKLRLNLATNFTQDVYEQINNGHLKSFGDNVGSVFAYGTLREGLFDYTHWFGLEFLTFVQDQLDINVHILWIEKGVLQFYRFAPDRGITFRPQRDNVLLFWEGRNHFQPVGRSPSGAESVNFVFRSDEEIFTRENKG